MRASSSSASSRHRLVTVWKSCGSSTCAASSSTASCSAYRSARPCSGRGEGFNMRDRDVTGARRGTRGVVLVHQARAAHQPAPRPDASSTPGPPTTPVRSAPHPRPMHSPRPRRPRNGSSPPRPARPTPGAPATDPIAPPPTSRTGLRPRATRSLPESGRVGRPRRYRTRVRVYPSTPNHCNDLEEFETRPERIRGRSVRMLRRAPHGGSAR